MSNALFEPFVSEKLSLKNRVMMAPMTRSMAPKNQVTQDMIDYYVRRAKGGVGLIITEGVCIDHDSASGYANVPFIGPEESQAGWSELVSQVHKHGGKIAVQLWHVGAVRRPGIQPGGDLPGFSPSGFFEPGGKITGREMTQSDIDEVVTAYANSAKAAKQAGFDSVEIHGAHGYLIDQFFWEQTNQRQDGYSGSMQNRCRFGVEVVSAIRVAVGEDYPIILRFSQWKMQDYTAKLAKDEQQLKEFLGYLSDAGVDIFHCSTRRFWEPEFAGSDLNLAGWVKKLINKPAVTVGSVGLDKDFIPQAQGDDFRQGKIVGLDELLTRLQNNEFDLVALGRALIANPDWAIKVQNDQYDKLKSFDASMLETLV